MKCSGQLNLAGFPDTIESLHGVIRKLARKLTCRSSLLKSSSGRGPFRHDHFYILNASARNLRLQRTNTIAVILNASDRVSGEFSEQPYMSSILDSLCDELSQGKGCIATG